MARTAIGFLRGRRGWIVVTTLIAALAGIFMLSGVLTTQVIPSDSRATYSAPKTTGGSKRMAEVGVNLGHVNYWGQEYPFINRFKTMNPWTATKESTSTRFTAPTDANGYPIGQPNVDYYQALVPIEPVSAGHSTIYHIYYDGDANIIFNGSRTISEKPGEKVVDLAGSPGLITMYPGASGKLPTTLALVREDQIPLYKAGEIFNPAFIEKLSSFSEIRLMDWGNTNGNTIENWADRTTFDSMSWAQDGTKSSVPWEVQVALANKLNKDIWVNIPAAATDDYVRKALTYIRDNLNDGLTVKIEYSNEVWNDGFPQSKYAQAKAAELWGEVHDGPMQYYGYRSAQIASIAKQVFANDTNIAAQFILSTQTGYYERTENVLTGVARANLGSVADLFDVYAVTNYWGTQFAGGTEADRQKVLEWAKSGKAGLDAAFHELEYGGALTGDTSLKVSLGWIDRHAKIAKENGLSLEVYEGGVDLLSFAYSATDEPIVQAFFQQILADPRIGEQYTKAINSFAALGGAQWDAYMAFGGISRWGNYGALNSVYDAPNARFQALVDAANAGSAPAGGAQPPSPTPPPPVVIDPNAATPRHDLAPLPVKAVADAPAPPTVIGDQGENIATLNANFALPTKAKTLTYIGEANFSGIGNTLANVITGGPGADRLLGLEGDDTINGGAGIDTLDGGPGDDILDGGTGDDIMTGGAGNDQYVVDSGADRVVEAEGGGIDAIRTTLASSGIPNNVENLTYLGSSPFTGFGNQLDNVIVGANAGNKLYGDAGNDTLRGGDGTDEFDGGTGDDAMYGGGGNDRYSVDSANDRVFEDANGGDDRVDASVSYTLSANVEQLFGQSGTGLTLAGNDLGNMINGTGAGDVLTGLGGDDLLFGNEGNDVIDGGEGNDVVGGGAGNDMLSGGLGDDTVNGGAGDDVLRGGGGCDILSGEAGADTFSLCQGDLSIDLARTVTIGDFARTEGDKIDLRTYDANVSKVGIDPFAFIGTAAFGGTAGELRVEKNAGRWIVQGDTNGDGVADFSAIVSTKIQLIRSDFLI